MVVKSVGVLTAANNPGIAPCRVGCPSDGDRGVPSYICTRQPELRLTHADWHHRERNDNYARCTTDAPSRLASKLTNKAIQSSVSITSAGCQGKKDMSEWYLREEGD